MSREDIKYLLKIVIFIALIVVAIRFFLYLLPFIIIALIIMLIYDSYIKKRNEKNVRSANEENNKSNVIDAEIVNEKENK